MAPIDDVRLAFDPASLTTLNIILGLVMFGVALDLKVSDFRALARTPRAPMIGLVCQLLLLPALTYALTRALALPASMSLGMMLIAACPGGNMSNYVTHLAGGRTATSVGMTAVSTLAAMVVTPFNVTFWGRLHPDTAPLVRAFALEPVEMLGAVSMLLAVPVLVGMSVAAWLPRVAGMLRRPFKVLSLVFFVIFLFVAFQKNVDVFLAYIGLVFAPVALMNAAALGLGWTAARTAGLDPADRRAVAIEVGIQNSGLGLVLVFDFFDGLGGMAVVCAWWGLWHLISGLSLAGVWRLWDRRQIAD